MRTAGAIIASTARAEAVTTDAAAGRPIMVIMRMATTIGTIADITATMADLTVESAGMESAVDRTEAADTLATITAEL
jgi:K+/H+ antiporter YhaU regulatory subunit KhtT